MFTAMQRAGRRLILVDIENLTGGAVMSARELHVAQAALVEALPTRVGDHVIVACGRSSAQAVGFGWIGPRRLLVRAGVDGADLALLSVIEDERVAERFQEVVVVSGDGIFTEAVTRLASCGLRVTVIACEDACSRALRMAAARTILVPRAQQVEEAA